MKKIVFVTAISFLLASCHDNTGIRHSGNERQLKVSPCIEDAFCYFLEHEIDNPDTTIIYSMDFLKGCPGCPEEDTLIGFCRMNENMPTVGLRGLMTIDGWQLLVFDEQRIGESFYSIDSLKEIDLNGLRLSTERLSICCTFVIDDGFLHIWGVQPDDYMPIKIKR